MRIYLTSGWSNRPRMGWLKGWLEKQGHVVTSTWFERDYPADVPADWWAPIDIGEVRFSDAVLLYTLELDDQCKGAMDFEAGYALGLDKKLFYIGDARNIFLAHYATLWPATPRIPQANAAA